MPQALINLKIRCPFEVFIEISEVGRVVFETSSGSFGILPHRLDCVAALSPGILTFQVLSQKESYIAVDEGLLVKTGSDVHVSVRNAIGGANLNELRVAVKSQFIDLDKSEKSIHAILAKVETSLLHRLSEFQHE